MLPIFVVDAFTSKPFAGNPAGVCLLDTEADSVWMQNVAKEMNHAETAFVRPLASGFELRWFTPSVEVDLCGHATLASAHVLWESGTLSVEQSAEFHTRSGVLVATKHEQIHLDFPSEAPESTELPHNIPGLQPIWTGRNRMDWIVELTSPAAVRNFEPDFDAIGALGLRGLQITSTGDGGFDFISRFFAPQSGVLEDAVTGSAHCCLGPYWAAKLGKTSLIGYQASERGGVVGVEVRGDRVQLLGNAVTVLQGTLRC